MDQGIILDYGREAIILTLKLGAPTLLVALIVGVAIGLLQALTQIQEMTLSFVPKIVAMFLTLFAAIPYMGHELIEFTRRIADQMIGMPIN
jgi:flagellar biosynthetic protein FliQ